MRAKTWQLLVTFSSTVQAMAFEQAAQEEGLPGRLIPVPKVITAGCGLAYKAPPEAGKAVEALLSQRGCAIEGIWELEL